MEGRIKRMTSRTLIRRSLRFHARAHVGVVIGAAIAGAALIGALVVGDSVRESLRERALARLGWVHFAMAPQDRFFSPNLISCFADLRPGSTTLPPLPRSVSVGLNLPGTISRPDGTARANKINVIGVQGLSPGQASDFPSPPGRGAGVRASFFPN